ncbi:hypothetical protein [Streptomyces sp. NPDC019507]|uniref:hypothetical protein n=1 Tax=Streptomyces sp. NPDC019507 TaxID=3154689 RepID=UPI00340F1A37
MIRRRAIGVAVATTLLGGLGAYGATAALAASASGEPRPTPPLTHTQPSGNGHGMGMEELIRHCTDHLPADQRDKARQHMEEMMSGTTMGGRDSQEGHHRMG